MFARLFLRKRGELTEFWFDFEQVAMRCRDRLHELVKEELLNKEASLEWKLAMERSFDRMDKEVIAWNEGVVGNCRCELQTPECDAVGSTAVVAIVTPQKIIVANCGDSRAVLCRNGRALPLSSDHKVISLPKKSPNYSSRFLSENFIKIVFVVK